MLMQKLLASAGGVDKLYIDDLFQAYVRTGTGASATVTTDINLSVKGGMIWSKGRSGATDHAIYDTTRGATFDLASNLASAQTTQAQGLTAFGATGHTWGTLAKVNTNAATYVDYVFAKAPKFFDVVTWTGNGANRTIPHALGQEVGMMLVKRTNSATDWQVYHRSLANTEYMVLNSTAAKATGATRWNSTTPTTSGFRLGTDASVNASGGTYVAYIFAHDSSANGIIQCGIYTGNSSSSGPTVGLGWEPQYVLVKSADHATDWWLWDSSRGLTNNGGNVGTDPSLFLNQASAEELSGDNQIRPLSTGFQLRGSGSETNLNGFKYIYLAIRRPNKPPTTGTEVYNHLTRTGSGSVDSTAAVGFAPDLAISQSISVGRAPTWVDRLRGVKNWLYSHADGPEQTQTTSGLSSFDMLGVSYTVDNTEPPFAWNNGGETKHQRFFKRAPGFFDVVCYTGAGVAGTVPHSLGVAPELMIVKARSGDDQTWVIYHKGIGNGKYLGFDTATPSPVTWAWNNTTPSSTSFTVGEGVSVSLPAGRTFIAYLFATLPGISKVGSYTGNGTTQTINCGFTTGSRFILIRRTDSTGDWYVWDTARGVVAGNDPHLSLNTIAAEVTTNDSIDPDASGFIVNHVAATNINVSGGQYIFLAIA